jgi:hypothetical protein
MPEQKIRAILFYASVILFFILLPIVLLYAFGYKLDISRFRFIKTGLIYAQTIPEGAKVYLNGKHLKKNTPVSIEGLLPGKYKVSLELESYYPWFQMVSVESGKTATLDNIILFPKKNHLSKINIVDVDDFYIFPDDKDYAYCVSRDRTTISKARLNSKDQELNLLYDQLELPSNIKDFSLSPDEKKIFYFNNNKLDILYLPTEKLNYPQIKNSNFFITTDDKIVNAFWYSDSEHIVVITSRDIKIYELSSQGKNNIITLLDLNDNHPKAFYDTKEDVLYFTDLQEGADGRWHRGLYRLDISKRSLFTFIKDIEEQIK